MPLYEYGCENPEHKRVEVAHGYHDNPDLWCSECGAKMHRVPQAFTWAWHPSHALFETFDRRFGEWKAKEKRRRAQSKP